MPYSTFDHFGIGIGPYGLIFEQGVNGHNQLLLFNGRYNNFAGIGIVINVAGCLIRGRRRWSVTYTSPRGLRSSEFRIWNIREFQERKPYQFPGWMKNSPYYIAPAGARTHDLPHTQTS